MKKILLLGSNASYLAQEIKGFDVKTVFTKKFPDGETYVRLPVDVQNSDIVYIQNFFPHQNDSIVEALLTIEGLKDYKANLKGLIAPYFPYARQDKKFLKGEVISFKAIIKLFSAACPTC